MDDFIPEIQRIAERVSDMEDKRKRLANFLKEINPRVRLKENAKEDRLQDLKILAVDGGISKRPVHGFDLVLARAVGVIFHYRNGAVRSVRHFPSRLPRPRPFALEALSELDYNYSTSIIRQTLEVERARECLKESPDIVLMDGSIVPHYADRPSKSSKTYSDYRKLLESWQGLYSECLERNIILAGVIEDSRGTMFCELVKGDILSCIKHNLVPELEKILDRTRDSNLLFWVLDKGERTMVYPYSPTPGEHPVLRELPKGISQQMFSFYLKTAEWDRPVRVDFLGKENLDRLAGVLLAVSGQHSGYGIPVPLIEADTSAKMSEEEMDTFHSQIMGKAGGLPSILRLRRDSRPF